MASTDQPDPPTQPGLPLGDAAAPPREALITTAVKFLQNPKVRQSPLATRKAFLKKKGLSDEEVELAIQRSDSTEFLPLSPVEPPHSLNAPQLVAASHSPTGYRWRDYGALTIFMVGITFGFHQLYKKYILPLIMGSREDKKHLQRMESNIASMSGTLTQTVSQLQQTLVSIQELLIQQQQKVQELSQEMAAAEAKESVIPLPSIGGSTFHSKHPLASSSTSRFLDNQTVGELKAEIVSLKGLLLSRKQFPSTPTIPKIPSWQIPVNPASAPGSPSVNSSSDISPVSNESANSSPTKDGNHSPQNALRGPDGAHGINGESDTVGLCTAPPQDLKDLVRMELRGEQEAKEEEVEDVSHAEDEVEDLSMQAEDRKGGVGQINERVDKLRRPEGASTESEVD